MTTKLIILSLIAELALGAAGQGAFTNLDFESAQVVVNEPTFGFLDWNLAAPGWGHSSGSDLGIVYYRQEHVGLTGYYMLYDSLSPAYAPGTQLADRYSLGFSSGYVSSSFGAPWQQNYLSQTGTIQSDAQSIRLLARGSFAIFVGGTEIPMQYLGGNAYAGEISAFAGTTTDVRIVNTSMTIHDPVVLDNIVFSPVAVPEPSTLALAVLGFLVFAFGFRKRRQQSLADIQSIISLLLLIRIDGHRPPLQSGPCPSRSNGISASRQTGVSVPLRGRCFGRSVKEKRKNRCEATDPFALQPKHRNTETPNP